VLEAISRSLFEAEMARLDARTLAHRAWTVVTAEFPVFDVIFGHQATPLRVRFDCTDWNDLPPSVALLHADGRFLTTVPATTTNIFNGGPHPLTGRPFICMRGIREFHTHESHLAERWENYRGQPGNDLLGLISQIWRAWKGANP
jgi:hypothetical protein